MLIVTLLVTSQLLIGVSSFPFLGKSVITHINKASLLSHSFLQASKDHMYMEGVPSLLLELHLLDLAFSRAGYFDVF